VRRLVRDHRPRRPRFESLDHLVEAERLLVPALLGVEVGDR
jgi:hypothetical protein